MVQLKVGVLPLAPWSPFYIAQERGYFNDVGLNVEFTTNTAVTEQLPSLAQGQLHVGSCTNALACLNALQRGADVRIVADLLSAGRTEKSRGGTGLVVRQDLWDSGTIREARDLVGRSIYLTVPASGQYIQTSRWLLRQNIDPRTIEWSQLGYPDILAAMQNGAIELGLQTEPLLSAGEVRGVHHLMVSQEEMDPNTEPVYVLFWTGIDRLGPQVGERFLVAMLRAVRDYVNAFEYGIDLDGVIAILTKETFIKDPNVYRQIKYGWVDPDGLTSPSSLQADADLFHELGLTATAIDLSTAFDDRYRQAAVQYLGEYRPPR